MLRLALPCAERGLPSPQLLSAVPLAVAGGDQGGVPRSRRCGLDLRPGSPLSLIRHAASERRLAEALRAARSAAGLHALQPVPAR